MSRLYDAMTAAPDYVWQLDNCVNLLTSTTQHRTWRPVRDGRPVYSVPGVQLFTVCGRPLPDVTGWHSGPRCRVCFREPA